MSDPYRWPVGPWPKEEKKETSMPTEAELQRKSKEAAHKRVIRSICFMAAMLFGTSAFLGRNGCGESTEASNAAAWNRGFAECLLREHPAK